MIKKIISGGQTGVDRSGLDTAIELGISHGGWCPKFRVSEDGKVPLRYQLRETETTEYSIRTKFNVRDSDGTLIVYREPLEGGTMLTYQLAVQLGKPVMLVELRFPPVFQAFQQWVDENSIQILNIAGPRESQRSGIWSETKVLLKNWLTQLTIDATLICR